MQTAPVVDVVIEVCGRPTPPGWITEPAHLLDALSRVEAGGWPEFASAPVALPNHGGAAMVVLAMVGVRLAVGVRSIRDLADRRARVARRLHELADAAVHRGPSAFLPASLGGRLHLPRRHPAHADPDPEHVAAAAERRPSDGRTPLVIPLRRGPSASAVPVDLPPHVAAMMARIRDTKTQQRAHSTYVRAERAPVIVSPPRPPAGPHPAQALRDALRARRAQAESEAPATSGSDRHSWVIDD